MSEQIREDFENHWKSNNLQQVSKSKLQEAAIFFRPLVDLLQGQPVAVLDIGCGDGVHWHYLRHLCSGRIHYTGVDISSVVVQRLRQQSVTERDSFVQMDATTLALRDQTYDVVFAFGVVAYAQDPQRCFTELCRVCKPGGWVGIWIYPRPEGLGALAFNLTRQICQRVGPFWTRRIADLIVPFLGILPTRSRMSLRNSSWHQCREVVLVNIAPDHLSFFQPKEVKSWFALYAIDIVYEDQDEPITLWGRRRS